MFSFKLKTPFYLSWYIMFFVGLLLLFTQHSYAEDKKIGYVGHSLINNDMPRMVTQIALSLGDHIENAVQVNNGASLTWNYNYSCYLDDFTYEWPPSNFICDELENVNIATKFDSLVVTDANNSIHSNYIYGQTDVYVELLMEKLKNQNSSAEMYLFTSWESLTFHGELDDWYSAIDEELTLYEEIAEEAVALGKQKGYDANVTIIPVNLALKRLLKEIDNNNITGVNDFNDIFVDDVHLNALGNYYVASVVYSVLFDRSPVGASGLTENQWGEKLTDLDGNLLNELQVLAWKTVSEYAAINTSPELPDVNVSLVYQGDKKAFQIGDSILLNIDTDDADLNSLQLSLEASNAQVKKQGAFYEVFFDNFGDIEIKLSLSSDDGNELIVKDALTFYVKPDNSQVARIESYSVQPKPYTQGIDLTWSNLTAEIKYYKVLINGVPTYYVEGDQNQYDIDWLNVGVPYSVQIEGYNESGELIAVSSTVESLAGDIVSPTIPQQLSGEFDSNVGVTISWADSIDNVGIRFYKVFRNGQPLTLTTSATYIDQWPPTGVVSYSISALDFQLNESLISEPLSLRLE